MKTEVNTGHAGTGQVEEYEKQFDEHLEDMDADGWELITAEKHYSPDGWSWVVMFWRKPRNR